MRPAIWTVCLAALLMALPARAFEDQYKLAPGSRLRIDMKYGELRVTGGAHAELRVKIIVRNDQSEEEVRRRLKVRYKPGSRESRLEISGLKNLHAEVSVPANVDLHAGLRAGELSVRGVTGNLKASVWAGEVTIEVPDRALYKSVRAHARIGSVAHPFAGPESGWIGRKYEARFAGGRYTLDASVWVGDVGIVERKANYSVANTY